MVRAIGSSVNTKGKSVSRVSREIELEPSDLIEDVKNEFPPVRDGYFEAVNAFTAAMGEAHAFVTNMVSGMKDAIRGDLGEVDLSAMHAFADKFEKAGWMFDNVATRARAVASSLRRLIAVLEKAKRANDLMEGRH